MSYEALGWAFQLPLKGPRKSVLVALADHADHTGRCHPGIERLALYAGYDERSVRRSLRDLERLGVIQTVCSRGGRRASDYRLDLTFRLPETPPEGGSVAQHVCVNGHDTRTDSPPSAMKHPDTVSPLTVNTRTDSPPSPEKYPDRESPQGGQRVPPARTESPPNLNRTIIEPQKDISAAPASRRAPMPDEDFDVFWECYPRKQGKDDARKAFAQRVKAGISAAEIVAGLKRHRFTEQARFIPYPATWLRKGHWLDETEPDAWDWLDRLGKAPVGAWDGETIDGEAVHATRPH